jgi:hypothetical protein
MYNREEEKAIMLSLVRTLGQEEVKFNKQQNFERAIELALDEISELEQKLHQFVADVDHLEVFQHSMKESLTREMDKMISGLRYLITKSYTQVEKDNMPAEVLEQVRITQQRRMELLKKVAMRYLVKPKSS